MTGAERTGVVLAGGRSRRFGDRDKALVEVDGEAMVARVVRRLAAAVDRIVVNCRVDQRSRVADALADADVDCSGSGADVEVPVDLAFDEEPDRGPLAGVRDALGTVDAGYAAVVACDLPGLAPDLVELLFDRAAGRDAAVPEDPDGHLQPALAAYRVEPTLAVAEQLLADERRSLRSALRQLDVAIVPADVVAERVGPRSLLDVDTPSDLEAFRDTSSRHAADPSGRERTEDGRSGE